MKIKRKDWKQLIKAVKNLQRLFLMHVDEYPNTEKDSMIIRSAPNIYISLTDLEKRSDKELIK